MAATEIAHDTAHTVVDTRLGEVTLVRRGDALVGVYFPHHWYMPPRATFGPRVDEGFAEVTRQLDEYLAGTREDFDLTLDVRGDPLQLDVWDLVARVPYGRTTTYGALAAEIGGGVTAQQIGAAVGRNPMCIVIPCHRVVGSTGKPTGYAGGIDRKRLLLELEYQPALIP